MTRQQEQQEGFEIRADFLQPWSTFVMKTQLPPEVLQTMIEITDQVIADKGAKSWGHNLAGQINSELIIEHDILNQIF